MLVFFEKKGNFGTAHGDTKNERPLNQVENHAYVLERCHLKQRQGEHKPPNGNDNEESDISLHVNIPNHKYHKIIKLLSL